MNSADPAIQGALDAIVHFIRETRQIGPAPEQLAAAFKRYFVLKEIADPIDLE